MYLMDFLIMKHKKHVEEAVIKREVEAFGFTSEQARDIICFYYEARTVVHFWDSEESSRELGQILVCDLNAARCSGLLLYDVKNHVSKRYDAQDKLSSIVANNEKTEVFQKAMFDALGKDIN